MTNLLINLGILWENTDNIGRIILTVLTCGSFGYLIGHVLGTLHVFFRLRKLKSKLKRKKRNRQSSQELDEVFDELKQALEDYEPNKPT
jgi:hypothetical protein